MKVAIIGGGINGVMSAWELAKHGADVHLFERGHLMRATSSASTKMLHGGIRYLEHGHLGLVREALQERTWWMQQVPHLVKPLQLVLPIYQGGRSKWLIAAGVSLYEMLAIGSGFPAGKWLDAGELKQYFPALAVAGLRGGYSYWDAQMDDYRLGMWAAEQAKTAGVEIFENSTVHSVNTDGLLRTDTTMAYDRVINLAGPWAQQLLEQSGIASRYHLNLIRGTHLVLNRQITMGCVLQVPGEKRLVFLLPYQGNALLGTTEVFQPTPERIEPSPFEVDYLLSCYNSFFSDKCSSADVITAFAGLRPIVAGKTNYSSASRESVIERNRKLINVFGGKWTTSRALAKRIAKIALH